MKLYYKPGACSLAVHIILNEICLEFDKESVDTQLKQTASGADFLAISPNGYVPALTIDDTTQLVEAPAILQYLADQFPETQLAPSNGTIERALLQQYLNFLSSELHKAFGPFFSGIELSDTQRLKSVEVVNRRLAYVNAVLALGKDYLLGDTFSVADAYLFVILTWTGPTQIGLDHWPLLQAYLKRISDRTATQAAMKAEGLV